MQGELGGVAPGRVLEGPLPVSLAVLSISSSPVLRISAIFPGPVMPLYKASTLNTTLASPTPNPGGCTC